MKYKQEEIINNDMINKVSSGYVAAWLLFAESNNETRNNVNHKTFNLIEYIYLHYRDDFEWQFTNNNEDATLLFNDSNIKKLNNINDIIKSDAISEITILTIDTEQSSKNSPITIHYIEYWVRFNNLNIDSKKLIKSSMEVCKNLINKLHELSKDSNSTTLRSLCKIDTHHFTATLNHVEGHFYIPEKVINDDIKNTLDILNRRFPITIETIHSNNEIYWKINIFISTSIKELQ